MPDNSEARFDPIPENRGRRGRPPHISTERNRNNIKRLLALGWTSTCIAQALRITSATLRKYYFRFRWRRGAGAGETAAERRSSEGRRGPDSGHLAAAMAGKSGEVAPLRSLRAGTGTDAVDLTDRLDLELTFR